MFGKLLGLGYIIAYVKEYCKEEDLDIQFFQRKFDPFVDTTWFRQCLDSDIVAFSLYISCI